MENAISEVNVVLDKKLEGYSGDNNLKNFVAPQEITVTITIAEYRELVQKVATAKSDIDKAEADRYQRNSENEKLRKEVSELKAKLYELQSNMNNAKGDEIMVESQKEPRLNIDEMY